VASMVSALAHNLYIVEVVGLPLQCIVALPFCK